MAELFSPDVLRLLACPHCGGAYRPPTDMGASPAEVTCNTCRREVVIVNGIPRFVEQPVSATARRTQKSFGYEWTHFNDWRPSGTTNFNDYFQGLDLSSLAGKRVLDAGCGMGRHARQIAPAAGLVIAADFSAAIDQAARNTGEFRNVTCIQADLLSLPLANEAFDFVYSLGVLHHLDETERALQALVSKLKPGGRLRIYLYWKRHGIAGALLSLVTLTRRVTTRLPFWLLKMCCWILSTALYALVVVPYKALSSAGVHRHESWPLFVYSKYPFRVLYNDQFDRFSAPIEKRYDREDVVALMRRAGLSDIEVRPCFGWVADGMKR
jgi:SAM-dependent methyltransferase